jgi:hypothetical protein
MAGSYCCEVDPKKGLSHLKFGSRKNTERGLGFWFTLARTDGVMSAG